MFAAKLAVCCSTSCTSNANRTPVACCSACGKCGSDGFHDGCTATSGMQGVFLGGCSGSGCLNGINAMQVLVCAVDGQCGDCSFHRHG